MTTVCENSLIVLRHIDMCACPLLMSSSFVRSLCLVVYLVLFFYLDPKKGLCPFLRPKMKKRTIFLPLTPSVIDVRHHHRHRYYGTRRNVLFFFSNIFLNWKKPFAIRFCLSLVLPVRLVLTDKKTKESNHRQRLIHPFLQTKKETLHSTFRCNFQWATACRTFWVHHTEETYMKRKPEF